MLLDIILIGLFDSKKGCRFLSTRKQDHKMIAKMHACMHSATPGTYANRAMLCVKSIKVLTKGDPFFHIFNERKLVQQDDDTTAITLS
jgi:hypothetical protein